MNISVLVTLFLLADVNTLASVTLRSVEVDPPIYTMTSDAAYARCTRFLPSLFLAMGPNGGNTLDFVSFIQIFSAFSESSFGKLYIIGLLKVCSLLL